MTLHLNYTWYVKVWQDKIVFHEKLLRSLHRFCILNATVYKRKTKFSCHIYNIKSKYFIFVESSFLSSMKTGAWWSQRSVTTCSWGQQHSCPGLHLWSLISPRWGHWSLLPAAGLWSLIRRGKLRMCCILTRRHCPHSPAHNYQLQDSLSSVRLC